MEVRIAVAAFDQGTEHILWGIVDHLKAASRTLSGDYGPGLDHLWIDLELSPITADVRPPWPFRFQRRVHPKPILTGIPVEPSYNVGHFSVRPDYFELAKVAPEKLPAYVLRLVYDSTAILESRQRTFPKFDTHQFRKNFREYLDGSFGDAADRS